MRRQVKRKSGRVDKSCGVTVSGLDVHVLPRGFLEASVWEGEAGDDYLTSASGSGLWLGGL